MTLVNSKDYGEDEPTAQSLLQRHRDLQGELKAYQGDVQSLNSQAQRLITLGVSSLRVRSVWFFCCFFLFKKKIIKIASILVVDSCRAKLRLPPIVWNRSKNG